MFDPSRVCRLSEEKEDYLAIPGFRNIPDQEFRLYCQKYAKEAVAKHGNTGAIDLDMFWVSSKEALPHLSSLALTYINAVCNSADVERSFSLYNLILTSRRHRLAEKTIKSLAFLYYNLNEAMPICDYFEEGPLGEAEEAVVMELDVY